MNNNLEKIFHQFKQEEDIFTKAKLINYLIREKQLRIVDLAKKLNIQPSYICHLLRLNHLPPVIVDGYYSKLISVSHLFVISRIKDKKKLISLYEKILAEDLTVSATEEAVRQILHQTQTKGTYLSRDEILQWINTLKSKLKNVELKVIQTRIKSKLIFEVKGSLEETTATIKKILEKLAQ